VIFGDKTLRQMAREYPCREKDMQGIFGMGEKKREEFGAVFARFITEFLENNPSLKFPD
jgi:ATP-dependent DNA helicase RecQ